MLGSTEQGAEQGQGSWQTVRSFDLGPGARAQDRSSTHSLTMMVHSRDPDLGWRSGQCHGESMAWGMGVGLRAAQAALVKVRLNCDL